MADPNRRLRFGRLLLALLILGWSSAAAAGTIEAVVKAVIDGDSIVLEDEVPVRYIGIDAPEMADGETGLPQPFAEDARRCNEELVRNRRVRLAFDRERRDRYERLLAYVHRPDGLFVQEEILRRGLAFVLFRPPNVRRFPDLLEVQRRAMTAAVGLWGRSGLRTPVRNGWVGSARSRVFHRNDCRWGRRIHTRNRVAFHRLWDAFWEGYAPCRRCRP